MDAYLEPPGFLGTGASLLADVTLLAYLLLIVPAMLLGLLFARRKLHRPHHKWLMIAITAVNWVLIIFLMFAAYRFDVAPNIAEQPGNSRYLLPLVHGLLGIPAQLLATFIVVRMLLEDTQVARAKRRGERDTSRYWFRRAKPVMRLTLALWLVTATFGVLTYLTRYSVIPAVTIDVNVAEPVSTDEVSFAAATGEAAAEPPIATQEIVLDAAPEVTVVPPLATEEVRATDATAESTPVSTPEIIQPEIRAAATVEAPVSTPEITKPTQTRRAPVATREVAAPATTPEAPVSTPEVEPPVETPEVSVSDDFRVEGRLEAVGSSAVIVDGQRYDIRGARIDDPLRVGAFVRMEVRSVNGVLVVERIRVEDDDD